MLESNIITLVGIGLSLLLSVVSILLKNKNPRLAKTFEEISEEALNYGNLKANKYLVKQCKKYKIDLADKSSVDKKDNTSNNENLSNIN